MSPSVAELPISQAPYDSAESHPDLANSKDLSQIWEWNKTLPVGINSSIHEWFVEKAQLGPQRPAVLSWDGDLSYGELDRRSSQLANLLLNFALAPGSAIPLCFEKSMWTVVALLAVMKAGFAFVLTDPSQPESRLRTIAEEIDAKLVLTSEKHTDLGSRIASTARVLAVGPAIIEKLGVQPINPLPGPHGEATMYIIFTSGSTGKPKGVVISHANYTSGAIPRTEIVGYRDTTRVLDFASYAFDVSIDCMLCTLATGGCICIPSENQRLNNLSCAIRNMNVNMIHTTPSVARILDRDIIPSLEVLGLGGEAISPHDASTWRQQTQVVIAYGPSECTVGCAFNNHVVIGGTYTSLGKGVGGLLWIVDPTDHDKLMPVGEIGELLVEGPIVGQGYLNEPEKTAAAYIEDPKWLLEGSAFIPGRHGRLYKTGDLISYDPEGSGAVVFVGRKDQQVKLRGQRVELGEVEHHLRSRLTQKTGVVAEVITPGGSGDPILVAFVTEGNEDTAQVSDNDAGGPLVQPSPDLLQTLAGLEISLAEDIPKYMIPSAYIALKEIPITVTGKTDRKQLRTIGSNMSRKDLARLRVDACEKREPRTEMQRKLQRLWIPLLDEGPDIGLNDNFFAFGGDSLKAMRLVAGARKEGLLLTVAGIFTHPTLAGMSSTASTINTQGKAEVLPFSMIGTGWTPEDALNQGAQLCNIDQSLIEDMYPCTPLQEGLMALSAKIPEAYVAQRVLELQESVTADALRIAFNKAVEESPILRTRVVQISSHGLMQVVVSGTILWHFQDSLGDYLAEDRHNQMELGKPLIRCALINDRATGRQNMVLTIHHALYDGWSMPLIVERMNKAYEGVTADRSAAFKDFVRYLSDMDRPAAERFWRDELHGASHRQFPALPNPGYQVQADSLLEHYASFPKASAPTKTLATAIRTAWAIVASHYSGSEDVIFGETLTGRNAPIPGVEQIEGPMITTVPVRVSLQQQMMASDLLGKMQQHTVSRIPHEHLGLQHIRRLSPDARLACELRTGLVLHPCAEKDAGPIGNGIADELVPADDAAAANEALKFNSYALMLVCTLEPSGFLTMASFDSRAISVLVMKEVLDSLGHVVQQLCQNPEQTVREIQNGIPYEEAQLQISRQAWYGKSPTPDLEKINGVSNASLNSESNVDGARTESPSSRKEILLIDLWSQILKVEKNDIDLSDSFFDLGGDSIGAMKLVSEVRQNGYALTVAEVFAHRRLQDMASRIHALKLKTKKEADDIIVPFTALDVENISQYVEESIRPALSQSNWRISDVLPARPLQEIAVQGTIQLPRYSARYELISFDHNIDKANLFNACRRLVAINEILRTVFVEVDSRYYGVCLENVDMPICEYSIDTDLASFSEALCNVDVQTLMPLGQPFLKFIYIQGPENRSCLIIRISHAQYDEICLPIILRQLSSLYSNKDPEASLPFSSFVHHVHRSAISQSIPYWRKLLKSSTLTILPPPAQALTSKAPISLTHRLSTAHRPKAFTLATFPTAAWALTLSRLCKVSDVAFGEVVAGRSSLSNAETVVGPCWQYIPVRIQFEPSWTVGHLLKAVQDQHVESARYSALGLSEILEHCVDDDFDKQGKKWYDSVVHQAVQNVERLDFGDGLEGRTQTIYPHLEPLREWKVQSFVEDGGDSVVLEIVTFEEWEGRGREVLGELVRAFEMLMGGGQGSLL